MLKRLAPLLLSFLSLPLPALELSVLGGKEGGNPFSTLHIKDAEPFICEAQKDDFDETSEIVCAFGKRPSQDFKPLSNNFFSVTSETRGETYFIIVKPFAKMALYPVIFELFADRCLFDAPAERADHWMVVGYREKLPMLRQESYGSSAINFPVTFNHETMPYVGGLDIKGHPIEVSRVKDVSDYVAIKRFYKMKSYDKVLELSEATLAAYPDTIFRSELLLYQIRAYHERENPEELLEVAKRYLRTYAGDENVPEVLAYTANAYAKMGLYIDADYFFDRLFTEHGESRWATLGRIYKAEQLVESGNSTKAVLFYEEALNQSRDVDLAAQAAFELAQHYLDHGEAEKAVEYARKILGGDPEYFNTQMLASREMALAFANRGHSEIAAGIAGVLIAKLNKGHELYEPLLKDLGVWLAEAHETEKAVAVLDDYLTAYQYGDYIEEVKRAKDALFFDLPDSNASQRLDAYDALIRKYGSGPIADKACYQKAKLLMEKGRYGEVLEMNASLAALDPQLYEDADMLSDEAATRLMEEALESRSCERVVALAERYSVSLDAAWDEKRYECAYVAGRFDQAKAIASRHLKSKEIEPRAAWVYRYIETDFATGSYEEAAAAAAELIALLPSLTDADAYRNIYRIRFDADQRLGDTDGMIAAIGAVEAAFGTDYDDIERYTQMVTLGKERRDSTMVELYAGKVMQLQRQSGSFTQSPYIEFTLAQALTELQKNDKAYATLATLDERSLTPPQRARAKYLQGSLLQKLGRSAEAKRAFTEAVKAEAASPWGKLAQDALALLP